MLTALGVVRSALLGLVVATALNSGAGAAENGIDNAPLPLAQQTATPTTPATETVSQPAALWSSLDQLFNVPPWLSLGLQYSAQPLVGNNPTLTPAVNGAWIQQVVLSSTLSTGLNHDVAQWREGDHWSLNLQLTTFNGDPNLNLALQAAFPLQSTAHPIGLWLTEAYVQRNRGSGAIQAKAGLLPLNPSFIDNPVFDLYVHSALNDTLNLAIPGLPINPLLAPGAEVSWRLSPSQELKLGSYWLDAQTGLAGLFGVNPNQPEMTGSLQIVQWTLSQLPGANTVSEPINTATGLIARQLPEPLLMLGAFTTTASSMVSPVGRNQVVYGALTLPTQLPFGLDNRLWLAFNAGLNHDSNPLPLFMAGGWLSQGLLPGRPFDVLGLGLGRTSFSPQLIPASFEGVVELNYTITLSSQLSLQPVVQWIINPGGTNNNPGFVAAGLQINLSL